MGCCNPSVCCTFQDQPRRMDACMCGCAYLNGGWAILVGQVFTLFGGLLSVGSMIDCSFATIDPIPIDLGDEDLEIDSIVGVGFLFFQKPNGHCYWYNYAADAYPESKLQIYWNLLGKPWAVASGLTFFCAACSWYFFLYSISFCCSSQVKQIRYFIGFMLAGILTLCQACTFIVYAENFCQQNNCSFSRGSGIGLSAMVCYIIAGMGFFSSKDYPGPKVLDNVHDDERPRSDPQEDRYEEKYYDEERPKSKPKPKKSKPQEVRYEEETTYEEYERPKAQPKPKKERYVEEIIDDDEMYEEEIISDEEEPELMPVVSQPEILAEGEPSGELITAESRTMISNSTVAAHIRRIEESG